MATEGQKKSRLQEKRITQDFNKICERARLTVGSGNKWFCKSDVVTERFQIECKTKVKSSKSFAIQKEWLDKIEQEAYENGYRIGILTFNFGGGDDYIIINNRDFLKLIDKEN